MVSFDALTDHGKRRVPVDRAVTIEVSVDEAGSVEFPDLELTASCRPVHARAFRPLPHPHPGNYQILFTPARGDESKPAGTLQVTESS